MHVLCGRHIPLSMLCTQDRFVPVGVLKNKMITKHCSKQIIIKTIELKEQGNNN